MLASILQEAGYKTGLYTSPHLVDFRERIRVDGKMISEESVMEFFKLHRPFFEANQLSFFEMTVGLAFDYFYKQKVDIAVVEVGLGGRLDSTNVLTPMVSAITNISLDHTDILGDSLAAIANEKAGIIKEGVPVVVGEEDPCLIEQFEEIAKQHSALSILPNRTEELHPMDLKGIYQRKNQQLVRAVVTQLVKQGFDIPKRAIGQGLARVSANTGLQGRWQQLSTNPRVICDTAHNPEGIKTVMEQLRDLDFEDLHMVIGMVSDKDIDAVLSALPKEAVYYFVSPAIKRAVAAESLQLQARAHQLAGTTAKSVEHGYLQAMTKAKANDVIFVGGSSFVVAEVLAAELN